MLLPMFLIRIDEQNMYSMASFILNEASEFSWGWGCYVVNLGSEGC